MTGRTWMESHANPIATRILKGFQDPAHPTHASVVASFIAKTYEDEGAVAHGAEELHEQVKVGHVGGEDHGHDDHGGAEEGARGPLDGVGAAGLEVEAIVDVGAEAVDDGLKLEHDRGHRDRVREHDVGGDDHRGEVGGPVVRQADEDGRGDVVAVDGVADDGDGEVHAAHQDHADRERAPKLFRLFQRLLDVRVDGVAAKGERDGGEAREKLEALPDAAVRRRHAAVRRQVDERLHDHDDHADGRREHSDQAERGDKGLGRRTRE